MQRSVFITQDGSHSIEIPGWQVSYHSRYGAIRESLHVYIEAGLRSVPPGHSPLRIFEMGLGTGLNALLTIMESEKKEQPIYYEAVELFPLETTEASALNYCHQLQRPDLLPVFSLLHECPWNKEVSITSSFTFQKKQMDLKDLMPEKSFDLIYYDAFAPAVQPELWTTAIFKKLAAMLAPHGKLVTYCAKGEVKRNMLSSGFHVEKLPGPPGKKEMLRASI